MSMDPRLQQFLFRAFVPFTVFLVGQRLACHWLQQFLPAWFSWALPLLDFADLATVLLAWATTSHLLGHRVLPPLGWIVPFLAGLHRWLHAVIPPRTPAGRNTSWLPGVLLGVIMLVLLSTALSFYASPLPFWMLNMLLLTWALLANGSYARFCQDTRAFDSQARALGGEHERRIAALRSLADSLDLESREAIELEQLIEEAMTRFKLDLQNLNRT